MSEVLLNQAAYFVQRGDLLRAEAVYREVLKHDPRNFEAHDALAAILNRRGRPQEALAFYEQALAIRPDDAIAHSNCGGVLDALGRRQEALAHYERALAIQPDFTDATINFSVDVNSINTDNEMRDKHLKSDDFFNAEKFPAMTFKGTSFKKVSGNKYVLQGDLTIRDVTKKVTFDVTYGGTIKDPWGNTKAGFKARAKINRFDYNLKWNTVTEAGGAVVSKDVDVVVNLELNQEKS